MQNYNTEVLVIGGGSTGTGVARDLAMRGFETILVERFGISEGTTRRYHGLLHSGGRYVVKDPGAAKECVQENRILRRIMPHAIDDTGGFFVITPDDDPAFIETFLSGAHDCGLAVERVDVSQMLREEPSLNPEITHCFWVPDAVSYAYISTSITARSAVDHGATILTHHQVVRLLQDGSKISGVACKNARGEEVTIHADYVVNATGPLAGKIAAMADIPINIVPGKGTMVSIDILPLRTVLNRCRLPADGDIIVPKRGEAIVGTTDVEIEDPDQFGVTGAEIDRLLQSGEEMMPGYSQAPNIRAWAGVRPLFKFDLGTTDDTRDVSRSHALLDHEQRDGISGFITITGGKWTTHRLMAEETVDLICKKVGSERPCRTHLEAVTEELFD
ncbi:MAG: FAD-dependent oxidoreductase [Chloroflexota bacterium]|jgi:glycerol-3-phosphate dehydrogenase